MAPDANGRISGVQHSGAVAPYAAGSDMYKRRAGWKYAKTQARLFKFMKEQDFIGEWQYIKSCVIRSGSALAPNWLRKFMFEKVLRK